MHRLLFRLSQFFVCLVLSSLSMAAELKNIKAMWVWDMGGPIIKNTAIQNELFQYSKAPHGDTSFPINRLYFEARTYDKNVKPYRLISDPLTNSDKNRLRIFLRNAHAQGLKVEYLDGQALWVQTQYKNAPKDICRKVIAFNAQATNVNEHFDGIHFDIEPHTLGDSWRQNNSRGKDQYNDEYEDNFLEILRSCRQQIIQSGQTLTLSIDLGTDYSFYVTDLWDGLAREKTVNYISIMNYFNTLEEFTDGRQGVGGVVNNLRLAQGLPLVFGAETMPDTYVPADITFWNKGYYALKDVLNKTIQNYGMQTLFSGISVHHYNSFKAMKDGENTPINPNCARNDTSGVVSVTNLPVNIGCVMRTDTYEEKAPINGTATFDQAFNVQQVELYEQLNGPKDCSKFVTILDCTST